MRPTRARTTRCRKIYPSRGQNFPIPRDSVTVTELVDPVRPPHRSPRAGRGRGGTGTTLARSLRKEPANVRGRPGLRQPDAPSPFAGHGKEDVMDPVHGACAILIAAAASIAGAEQALSR